MTPTDAAAQLRDALESHESALQVFSRLRPLLPQVIEILEGMAIPAAPTIPEAPAHYVPAAAPTTRRRRTSK